jgi:hypothetical protein
MLELTTLTKVKTLLKNPDPALDVLITDAIRAYSLAAAEFCLRDFDNDAQIEYFDGGTSVLFLSRKPVTKIIGIWVDDDWLWEAGDLIPATNYRLLNANNGMVQYNYGVWGSGPTKGIVKVSYEGGYDEAPYDLEFAIRTQVAYKIKRRDDVGLTRVSFPDGTVQKRIIDEFLPEVKNVLDRYTPTYVG